MASDPLRLSGLTGVSDPLAARARDLHRRANAAEDQAARFRMERDQLILKLRQTNPEYWSYGKLAKAIGCSRELIALIIKKSAQ